MSAETAKPEPVRKGKGIEGGPRLGEAMLSGGTSAAIIYLGYILAGPLGGAMATEVATQFMKYRQVQPRLHIEERVEAAPPHDLEPSPV